jgi:hypothetical protein
MHLFIAANLNMIVPNKGELTGAFFESDFAQLSLVILLLTDEKSYAVI